MTIWEEFKTSMRSNMRFLAAEFLPMFIMAIIPWAVLAGMIWGVYWMLH